MLKSLVFLSAPISAKSKLRGTLRKYFGFTKGIPHSKIQMNPCWRETIIKKRKDSIPDDTKNIVRDFFLSNEISRETPLKKEVIKC